MRVRYELANSPIVQAECDLSEKEAKKLYNKLKENTLCKWAELVGEDDNNYMEVLESFDHTLLANTVYDLFGNLIAH